MYNTDMPNRAELPTSAQLIRSTLIAAGVAAALLVAVVLPAEYGIDPTGAGRAFGLAEMGEIKGQLAKEAEADQARDQARQAPATPTPEQRSSLLGTLFAQLVIGPAAAQPALAATKPQEFEVSLKPGEKRTKQLLLDLMSVFARRQPEAASPLPATTGRSASRPSS